MTKLIKLKYLVSTPITTGASKEALSYDEKLLRYIRISDFDKNGKILDKNKASIKQEDGEKYLLNNNDLLVAVTGGTVGKCLLYTADNTNIKACYAGYLARIRANKLLNIKYLYYFMNCPIYDAFKSFYATKSTIENISASKYANLELVYYPIEKQNHIVQILDAKFAVIDNLIQNQQKQIELLYAYKQSKICEVTTHGLNKNIKLKTSSIKWINSLPEHWKELWLSTLFYEHKEKNTNLMCKNLLSLSYGKIKTKDIEKRDGLLPESFDSYNIINKGDIVLRLTDLQNDHKSLRVGYSNNRGIVTSAYVTLRLKKDNAYSKYYYYLLHSYDIKKGFYGMGTGVRQDLNYKELKKLRLVYPPINEQLLIVDYLDSFCTTIDELVKLKQIKIEKLNEYKKSLIYEYVTGKREVKED